MQRNVQNIFRPHQADSLLTTWTLAGLSGQSFRTAHTNARTQYHPNEDFGDLRRRRPESLDEPPANDPHGPTKAATLPAKDRPPLDGILERERGSRLAECVSGLPVYYREVLSLRFEEEMKLEDIAVVLDAPLSTVKTRLRRGLDSLRVSLESNYPGERWT